MLSSHLRLTLPVRIFWSAKCTIHQAFTKREEQRGGGGLSQRNSRHFQLPISLTNSAYFSRSTDHVISFEKLGILLLRLFKFMCVY